MSYDIDAIRAYATALAAAAPPFSPELRDRLAVVLVKEDDDARQARAA